MKLKKLLGFVLAVAMVLSLMPVAFAADATTITVGEGKAHTTLDGAITAANGMTGDVTVEIYGKVEYSDTTADLTGAYDSISFVGKDDAAEISITRDGSGGYISGNGNDCTVNFTDLILSKPTGAYAYDAGFMNVYFTVYRVGAVNYTNCTFPDGACAQGCAVTYTDCDFANQTSGEYSLWVYANCDVTVINSEFTGVRGVKMYGEGAAKTGNLDMSGTTFTASVTQKPAIVLTYGESVTLDGNTYPAKGVFELDLGGDPNGTTVTSTDAITCVNDNGDCGVLVDGKIYTTVTDAAAAATSGSAVTVLYSTEESVTLPMGATLTLATGVTAPNVTVTAPVAKIGDTGYASLQAALDAAVGVAGGTVTVEILADIELTSWTPVYYNSYSASGTNSLTINGNGYTITGLSDMLFSGIWTGEMLEINDLTINAAYIEHDVEDEEYIGVGAIVGNVSAIEKVVLNNVHLTNSRVEGGHWTGGFFGYVAGYSNQNDGPVYTIVTVKDCSVTNSTIVGKGSVGGVVGHATGDAWTEFAVEDSEITGNTITSTGSDTNKAGVVMGTIGAAGQETYGKTGGVSVAATVSGNTVTSNGTAITTIYGRQGSGTGVLTLTGGTYENYPIEENVSYAAVEEGLKIFENPNGTYGVYDENYTPAPAGPTLYTITKAACENGKVTAQAVMASAGSTIKVSAEPAEGYKLVALVVTDAAGNEIEVVDGKIKMPASNITVSATFVYDLPFTDVADDNEHYAAIAYMYVNGLMIGTSEDEYVFSGEMTMTRAQIAQILYRLAGEPAAEYAGTFTDAPEGEWYTAAAEWAHASGIVVGTSEDTFTPGREITVNELAVLIYRYAQCQQTGSCTSTEDDWTVEFAAAMTWCVENGVLTEDASASDIADRYLAADMFYNVYNLLNK